jgi:hypothetical protein
MYLLRVKSFLARFWIEVLSLAVYFFALFPGRLNPDVEKSIRLMLEGESSANWTAYYFRILQLLTFNGKSIALISFLGLLLISYSCYFFIHSLVKSERISTITFRVMCIFPLMPIFGLTVQHDVFAWSGLLLLIADLYNKCTRDSKQTEKTNLFLVFFAIFISFTSFTGIVGVFGYILVLVAIKLFRTFAIVTVFVLMVSLLIPVLMVSPSEPALKLIPMLGDLKCIAQDNDSKISGENWLFLESLGSRTEWETKSSCLYADDAIFAYWNAGELPLFDFISNWAKICSANPRICLMAHIQRSSQALPPPFFMGQPNATETDYRIPIGENSRRSLQVFNEVVIDAPLNGEFERHQIPIVSGLESVVLMGAFVLNQNSRIWGWGGLWLFFLFTYILFNHRRALIVLLPMVAQLGLLFAASPLPDPRYVFGWILMGLSVSVASLTKFIDKYSKH